jgi:hypothetical protein
VVGVDFLRERHVMGEQKVQFEIRFDGVPANEAGIKAKRLRQALLDVAPDVELALAKDDPTNQELGATLVLLLGTPAFIAVANGIAAYLARDRAKITISKGGEVVAEGISGQDAVRIAEVFAKGRKK